MGSTRPIWAFPTQDLLAKKVAVFRDYSLRAWQFTLL